jgi:hypothetical protein
MWAMRRDILQRLAFAVALFVIGFVGAALGAEGWPNPAVVLLVTFGVCALLWVVDPGLQRLTDTAEENEEVARDGDVA